MEMVLARADRLCANLDNLPDDTLKTRGMKSGADYLNNPEIDISALISNHSGHDLLQFAKGLLQTFLRNITLPRDDRRSWEAALKGLIEAGKVWPVDIIATLSSLTTEINTMLSRYTDHKNQLQQQLEENFAIQTAQLQQNLANQTGMQMNISAEQHPKFQEEWRGIVSQLDEQYFSALEQYKSAITTLFTLE